ncbi:MAG: membrane protein insertion efficiency factor YidD [Bdellovibrionales bacterium]|nr:membrane protein insertion efficiency factor YidD [Bdellovibrionales bacterium]
MQINFAVSKSVRALHWVYKGCVSPFLGENCRFYPYCSNYAVEAIETHGVVKGVVLSIKRIFRCNPWNKGGYDPVPQKR